MSKIKTIDLNLESILIYNMIANNINTRKLTRWSIHKHIHTNILKYTYFRLTFFDLKTHGLTCNINMSSMPSWLNQTLIEFIYSVSCLEWFSTRIFRSEKMLLCILKRISRFKPFYFLFLMFCSFIICCNYLIK